MDQLFMDGVERMRQGAFDEAIKIFQLVVDQNPDHAQAHFNLGLALTHKEQWRQAGVVMRKYLNLAPKDPLGYLHMGIILRELHFPEKAMKCLLRAVELNSKNSRTWFELGRIHLQ